MFDYIKFKEELDSADWKSRTWVKFRVMHTSDPRNDELLSYREITVRATHQAKEEAFKAQLDAVLNDPK